jgi:hypothetical protein
MDAVDWSGLGFLAALLVACVGYLARQTHRSEDRLQAEMGLLEHRLGVRFDRIDGRLDRLEERYVRHLEQHTATR